VSEAAGAKGSRRPILPDILFFELLIFFLSSVVRFALLL
jgi:hypothetical protein